MVPQYAKHNTGVWKRIEGVVQKWGRNKKMRDTLYVAKGVTLAPQHIIGYTKKGIAVPRYFWMALVLQKGTEYYGLAFLSEHNEAPFEGRLGKLTLSIDELEQFLDLDLFPNFPDKVEQAFERQNPLKHTHIWSKI